ncbi:MAG TPA: hypothetical protein VEZ90_12600 [Blastocatellia bacterium]|nr:hypothetical protein [Blastocatellia bacterium]
MAAVPPEGEKKAVLYQFFFAQGLDITKPIRVGRYEAERKYVMYQSDNGEMITPEFFNQYERD